MCLSVCWYFLVFLVSLCWDKIVSYSSRTMRINCYQWHRVFQDDRVDIERYQVLFIKVSFPFLIEGSASRMSLVILPLPILRSWYNQRKRHCLRNKYRLGNSDLSTTEICAIVSFHVMPSMFLSSASVWLLFSLRSWCTYEVRALITCKHLTETLYSCIFVQYEILLLSQTQAVGWVSSHFSYAVF